MPYSNVAEVPDSVPAEFRKQWLEVWNSAFKRARAEGKSQKDAEASAFAQANGVIKKRRENLEEASESLSEVADGLIKIALAYTGEFEREGKKFQITESDLAQIAANLAGREAPVDYEHLSGTVVPPGWSKAAGWIRKPAGIEPFTSGHKALWGWVELTPAALAMVKQKEYRYFSPEIHWNERDERGREIGTRLAAGALTNRPFLKDLPPIELSDSDYQQLFGLAARDDGKLAAIHLSEGSERLVITDQVHVPSDLNNISVAYQQPEKEQSMKAFRLKKLTDGEHKGKIGVFEGDDLVGLAEMMPNDQAEPDEDDKEKMRELFAREVGAEGKRLEEIAALVRLATNPPKSDVQVLSETAIRDGKLDLSAAGKLADEGRVKFSTILAAQEAERRVDAAIAKGKVLPKQRAAALRVALSDGEAFKSLIEEGAARIDFRERGHGGDAATGGAALMAEVNAYAKENKVSIAEALSEVTKRNPDLWREYTEEVVTSAETEEEA
jgi:phage I-like protein